MNVTEIIRKYGAGELTLQEANEKLAESGTGLYLDPNKNVLTDEEKAATVVSDNPEEVSGYGLMSVGIGAPEKMHVANGKFDYDTGLNGYYFYIGDKVFEVDGDHIAAIEEEK